MKKLLVFLVLTSGLFAGSLRLRNDSPYKLRAVIRGSDGTYLGEMILLPEHFNTWTDAYSQFAPGEQPNTTMTPYTVQWYCIDGDEYGINTNMATGAAVIAESASGSKFCKPPKKKQVSPYGPHEDDEQLHNQNEVPESDDSAL